VRPKGPSLAEMGAEMGGDMGGEIMGGYKHSDTIAREHADAQVAP